MLCDFTEQFVLSGNTCVTSSPIPNCKVTSISDKCLQCEDKFYLNSTQTACNAVSQGLQISNCAFYNVNGCILCEKEFFFNGESCQESLNRIQGCEYYEFLSPQTCLKCQVGQVLMDGMCHDVTNGQGCVQFSHFQCMSCSQGYQIHENSNLIEMMQTPSVSPEEYYPAFKFSDFFESLSLEFHHSPDIFCRKILIKNCKKMDSNQDCVECLSGYILFDNSCESLPNTLVENCSSYSSSEACQKCQSDFFLDSNTCHQISKIKECKKYSEVSRKTECQECTTDYYVSSNGQCNLRRFSQSIPECKNLSIIGDVCHTCNQGFALTTDHLKCLASVEYCAEYLFSTVESLYLTCKFCLIGYYFNKAGICTLGTTEHCAEYETFERNSGILCKKCNSGYYLSSTTNQCQKHDEISACKEYSSQQKDQCQIFTKNYRELLYSNKCVQSIIIDKCVLYSSQSLPSYLDSLWTSNKSTTEFQSTHYKPTCLQCEKGFRSTDDGLTCSAFSSDSTCLEMSGTQCIQCAPGYTFLSSNDCAELEILDSSNCEVTDTSFLSVGCKLCANNAFRVELENSVICQKDSTLELISGKTSHCNLYSNNKTSVKQCESCVLGYSLRTDSNDCIADSSCNFVLKNQLENNFGSPDTGGFYFIKDKFRLFSLIDSECLDDVPKSALENCHVFVPGIKGKLVCLKCKENYTAIYEILTVGVPNYSKFDSAGVFISPVSAQPDIKSCVNTSQVLLVNDCEKYYTINTNQYGCLKCNHGFAGLVPKNQNFISECSNMEDMCQNEIKFSGLAYTIDPVSSLKFSWGKKI